MDSMDYKRINMHELLLCLANAADLVNPRLTAHHQKVAYLAYRIGGQMNLTREEQKKLLLAGLLHDVGALSYNDRIELIDNEPPTAQSHAEKGAGLLDGFPPLQEVAEIIRFHHIPWKNGEGQHFRGNQVSHMSHILHLADRVTVLVDPQREVIGQIHEIRNSIQSRVNTVFSPDLVDAFLALSNYEYIWLDLVYKPLHCILPVLTTLDTMELNWDEVILLAQLFSKIIDFRSPFTANHSAGVAKTAEKLAELAGFSESECKMMLIAGYLHDLGKLAIRNELLEKPSGLDSNERNEIKSHTFYTYRLLQSVKEFETINEWASFHHERMDGSGYPFRLNGKCLSLGSRIMAVADVFTAISENRPYRKSMSVDDVKKVLKSMEKRQALCPYALSILMENYDTVDRVRIDAQEKASIEYNYFSVNSE